MFRGCCCCCLMFCIGMRVEFLVCGFGAMQLNTSASLRPSCAKPNKLKLKHTTHGCRDTTDAMTHTRHDLTRRGCNQFYNYFLHSATKILRVPHTKTKHTNNDKDWQNGPKVLRKIYNNERRERKLTFRSNTISPSRSLFLSFFCPRIRESQSRNFYNNNAITRFEIEPMPLFIINVHNDNNNNSESSRPKKCSRIFRN